MPFAKRIGVPLANGTQRAIEDVSVGDRVWTLGGAKTVTDKVAPYETECVTATTAFGEQVHPTSHPVLTSEGWQSYASVLENGSTGSARIHRVAGKPPSVSVAARLLARDRSSVDLSRSLGLSTTRRPLGIFLRLWSESKAFRELVFAGPARLKELIQLVRNFSPVPCDAACAQLVMRTAPGYQSGCLWVDYPCDESPRHHLESAHYGIPTLNGAASPSPAHCTLDELDNTPECIPAGDAPYVHPYNGAVRYPQSASMYGACDMSPCGVREVFDLTVEDENHYITGNTLLVNKNSWMAFDEVTNWPSPAPINRLRACLRSAAVPADGLRFLLTGNPGGPGHNWVKARYIDPVRPYEIRIEYDEEYQGERARVFIPSLFRDNPALAENDPMYLSRLKESGPDWLVKAWIEGDWNIIAGGMFDDVLDTRTPHEFQGKIWGYGSKCAPFRIPQTWRVDRAFDWGSSAPFSVGWYAESDGTQAVADDGTRIIVPRGTVFRIAEWYGWNGQPNTGLKMLAKDVAKGILEREVFIKENLLSGQAIRPGPADTAIYNAENGVCIGDDMERAGVKWTHADKRPGSRKNGWEAVRAMMKAAGNAVIEEPALIVFDTCRQFWRTVPVAPRSDKDTDDLDTNTEDHLCDELRYRVMSVLKSVHVRKLSGL